MKRRGTLDNTLIYNGKSVIITKENQELFFEIQNNITTDLAEAVSIMMKFDIKDDDVWKIEIENAKNIDPGLKGGDGGSGSDKDAFLGGASGNGTSVLGGAGNGGFPGGGGQSVIDAGYNPLSINEDYFFPQTSEGRGSR